MTTRFLDWSEYKDSNLGPPAPKAGALPGCATLRELNYTLAFGHLATLLSITPSKWSNAIAYLEPLNYFA